MTSSTGRGRLRGGCARTKEAPRSACGQEEVPRRVRRGQLTSSLAGRTMDDTVPVFRIRDLALKQILVGETVQDQVSGMAALLASKIAEMDFTLAVEEDSVTPLTEGLTGCGSLLVQMRREQQAPAAPVVPVRPTRPAALLMRKRQREADAGDKETKKPRR